MICSLLTKTASKLSKAMSLVSIIGNPVCNRNNEKKPREKNLFTFPPGHLGKL